MSYKSGGFFFWPASIVHSHPSSYTSIYQGALESKKAGFIVQDVGMQNHKDRGLKRLRRLVLNLHWAGNPGFQKSRLPVRKMAAIQPKFTALLHQVADMIWLQK